MTSATATLELGFETLAERVDQTMNAVLALDVDARDKGMMLKQAVEDFHLLCCKDRRDRVNQRA